MKKPTERTNVPVINGDGFDQVDVASNRVVKGSLLKFTDGAWTDGDGGDLPIGTKMVALGITQCLQMWKDKMPVTILKQGDEPLPNVDELNAKIPKEEWELGLDDKPQPPWQKQFIVYLLNPHDASFFTYINGTVGARIAVERLQSRVAWMRQLRGAQVVAVVQLDSKPMKTKFGPKKRPEFTILEWRQLGAKGPAQIEHQSTEAGLQPVAPVTLKEELNDDIPYLG